jgi:serine/threonine protein kinase
MSPEQLQESAGGAILVDHRSDIFSLGVVLYEMITGRHPFERNPGLLMQQDPLPPSEFNRRIPERLEDITLRCLIKKPDQRCQRASELEQDLAALSLPPDWGLVARYGVIGLVLAGGLLGGGRFWTSIAPLPDPTPTPTATFTATTTFTPRPTVIFTVTPTDTTGVVTSTPLPTYTSTPTPPPTATPTETPAEEGTP